MKKSILFPVVFVIICIGITLFSNGNLNFMEWSEESRSLWATMLSIWIVCLAAIGHFEDELV